MLEVVTYKAAHLLDILPECMDERAKKFVTPEHAYLLEDSENEGYAFLDKGKAVACGGFVKNGANGVAWILIRKGYDAVFVEIVNKVRKILKEAKFKKIYARVDLESKAAIRWIKVLGFKVAKELKDPLFNFEGGECVVYSFVKA